MTARERLDGHATKNPSPITVSIAVPTDMKTNMKTDIHLATLDLTDDTDPSDLIGQNDPSVPGDPTGQIDTVQVGPVGPTETDPEAERVEGGDTGIERGHVMEVDRVGSGHVMESGRAAGGIGSVGSNHVSRSKKALVVNGSLRSLMRRVMGVLTRVLVT